MAIYGLLIVPALGGVARAPWWWWAGMYAPVLAACAWAGWHADRKLDALVVGVLAGVATTLLKWLLALAQAPGHLKSLAVEDPVAFWTTFQARVTFGFVVLLGGVRAARTRWEGRVRAGR